MNRTSPRALVLPLALFAAAGILCSAGQAHAQRYVEREEYGYGPGGPHWGAYLAGGISGGLQLIDGEESKPSLGGELRLGFSFGRRFQLYIDGDLSTGSHDYGNVTANDVMLGMRYFFYADPFVGVYGRAGLGVGIVTGNSFPGEHDTVYGLAESYGLGVEFRMGGKWSLSPEVFYRRTNETDDTRVDTLGLGILINFN